MLTLIERLVDGDDLFPFPMTPEAAAMLIVDLLLADLPTDRKAAVREAIEEWGSEWGDACAGVAFESMDG